MFKINTELIYVLCIALENFLKQLVWVKFSFQNIYSSSVS